MIKILYNDIIKKYHENRRIVVQSSPAEFIKKILLRIRKKKKSRNNTGREKYENCDLTLEYLLDLWTAQNGKCALTVYK